MNWKIKLSCKLLHFRIKIFLLILIFNKVVVEESKSLHFMETTTEAQTETQSMYMNDTNARQLNFNNITIEEDYDSEYPYEELLQLVKETKRILSSTNATAEKRMLNLNPSDYEIYLRSTEVDNQLFQSNIPDVLKPDVKITIVNRGPPEDSAAAMGPSNSRPESPTMGACDTVFATHKPKRLRSIDGTKQFIINLDHQFVQKWDTVKCRSPDTQCGIRSTLPEMYESVCEQNYSGTVKFFSVPDGEEITLSKQEYRQFSVPNGCNCKLRLATSVR